LPWLVSVARSSSSNSNSESKRVSYGALIREKHIHVRKSIDDAYVGGWERRGYIKEKEEGETYKKEKVFFFS
jgi:hypothetical protein